MELRQCAGDKAGRITQEKTSMASDKSGFRSRSESRKDETLCERYGRIGIPAVAAAQSAMHRCAATDEHAARRDAETGIRVR